MMKALASTILNLTAIFGSVAVAVVVDPVAMPAAGPAATVAAHAPGQTASTPAPAPRSFYSAASPLLSPSAAAVATGGLVAVPLVAKHASHSAGSGRSDAQVAPVARAKPSPPVSPVKTIATAPASAPAAVAATTHPPGPRVAGKLIEKPYALGAGSIAPPATATVDVSKPQNGKCGADLTLDKKTKSCVKAAAATAAAKANPVRTVPNETAPSPVKR
jgi:hypothetical protein